MLRCFFALGVSLFALTTAVYAAGPVKFDAILKAHAELPAQSFTPPPADAPAYFNLSGRYTNGARTDALYSIFDEKTGLSRPYAGQALQGFSGIRSLGDDRFLVLTDNGFGSKATSTDSLLMFHHLKLDWETGQVAVEKTNFLSDPDKLVPFRIVNETTDTRYLTGSDFDVESIQPVGDTFWFGDEFGPWLIQTDVEGVVLKVVATSVAGVDYKSPDNQTIVTPNPGTELAGVTTQRSGGFEGMAQSADGKILYPLVEKTFYDETSKALELVDGKPAIRMLEYHIDAGSWADTVRYYPLEDAANSIGDFNMIDDHRALIIERDQNAGGAWAPKPAMLKRIYLVDLDKADANGVLQKIGYIDLLDIKDPDGIAPRGTEDGVFTFPFETIEDVDLIDATTIIVANDNNFPYSIGREQGRADDNEFILLDVADLLKAE
ncbi:esterase-like activity of phytase family protein [uncultured Devosia sp.]|uniref:esterase-like activity of phytase family protein n=1 Tax=uncultured Devosia sp. TaxID=211434 RepID=UPI0035CA19E5